MWDLKPLGKDLTLGACTHVEVIFTESAKLIRQNLKVAACNGTSFVFAKSATLLHQSPVEMNFFAQESDVGGVLTTFDVETQQIYLTRKKVGLTFNVAECGVVLTEDNLQTPLTISSETISPLHLELKSSDTTKIVAADDKPTSEAEATHSRNVSGSTLVGSPIGKFAHLFETLVHPNKAIDIIAVPITGPAGEVIAALHLEDPDYQPSEEEMALLQLEMETLDVGGQKRQTMFGRAASFIKEVSLWLRFHVKLAKDMVGSLIQFLNSPVTSKVDELMQLLILDDTDFGAAHGSAAPDNIIKDRVIVEIFDQESPLNTGNVLNATVPEVDTDTSKEQPVIGEIMFKKQDALPDTHDDNADDVDVADDLDNEDQVFTDEEASTSASEECCEHDHATLVGKKIVEDGHDDQTGAVSMPSEAIADFGSGTNEDIQTLDGGHAADIGAEVVTPEAINKVGDGTTEDTETLEGGPDKYTGAELAMPPTEHESDNASIVDTKTADDAQGVAIGAALATSATKIEQEKAPNMGTKTTNDSHDEVLEAGPLTPKVNNEPATAPSTGKQPIDDNIPPPYSSLLKPQMDSFSFADVSHRPDFTGRAGNTFSAPNSAVPGERVIHIRPGRTNSAPPPASGNFEHPRPSVQAPEQVFGSVGFSKPSSPPRAARAYSPPQLDAFTGSVSPEMKAVSEKISRTTGVAKATSPSPSLPAKQKHIHIPGLGLTDSPMPSATAGTSASKAKNDEYQQTMKTANEAAAKIVKRAAIEKAVMVAKEARAAAEQAEKEKALKEKAANATKGAGKKGENGGNAADGAMSGMSRAERRAAAQKKGKALKKELKKESRA